MTDIVERLRDSEQPDLRVWVIRGKNAADEIERLRADKTELLEKRNELLEKCLAQRAEIDRLLNQIYLVSK